MPRYIDADALISDIRICGNCKDYELCDGNIAFCPYASARRAINESPTVEAEPIRYGRWIIDPGCEEYGKCSECEEKSGTQYDGVEPIPLLTAYCSHCGAKMNGGDK